MRSLFQRFIKSVRTLPPQEAYNLWAATYDEKDANPLILIEEKLLTPFLDSLDLRHKAVIDFGCGTGRYFKRYFSQGARNVAGVDFSASMLNHAKTKSEAMNVVLLNGSLDSLPVRDSTFDIGISTLALGYVTNLKKAIAEMARVLRPGGTMLIADFHPIHKTVGWKRNFTIRDTGHSPIMYEIEHAGHSIEDYVHAFQENLLTIDVTSEPCVSPQVMDVFKQFNMTLSYHRYFGTPILLIFKLRKH